jgi:hypothetical protein
MKKEKCNEKSKDHSDDVGVGNGWACSHGRCGAKNRPVKLQFRLLPGLLSLLQVTQVHQASHTGARVLRGSRPDNASRLVLVLFATRRGFTPAEILARRNEYLAAADRRGDRTIGATPS